MTMSTVLDVASVRKEFPLLARTVQGKPLAFLDNAATSQKPLAVLNCLDEYYRLHNANVHRAPHTVGEEATALYEGARAKIAQFLNAPSPESIVFTKSTTEAINLVAHAWGDKFVGEDDELIVTEMEHHSNIVPWYMLCERKGCQLKPAPVNDDGTLDYDALERLITERTKMVAVTHMSNVLGTINPIEEITRLAHRHGAVVMVDGAQSAPHLPIDVVSLDVDYFAFSGHKMCGPTGSGGLYGRPELLEAMDPFLGGGEMISKVTFDRIDWHDVPFKFEAGTPCIGQSIGLGAAVDYLTDIGLERIHRHEVELMDYAIASLREMDGVTLYGTAPKKGGIVAFNLEEVHPHDLATFLDAHGIAIRAGHHCAQPLMRRFDVVATARASFYLYNTPDEIDRFVTALAEAQTFFGRG